MLESGFLLLPIFHRSGRLADILYMYMYTDSGNIACDLILFRAFFRWLPSAPFIYQNGLERFSLFELRY